MAKTKFYATPGIIQKGSEVPTGAFDLQRLVEWYLGHLNVPFIDECCPTLGDPDSLSVSPVRYNPTGDNTLQYFDTGTGLWTDVTLDVSAADVTATTVTSSTYVSTVDAVVSRDVVRVPTAVAKNITDNLSASDVLSGYITSTSAAVVSLTTPTATAIATQLLTNTGVTAARGVSFDFAIDNSAGANTVTLVLDGSISVNTPAITGGATLTVSVVNAIGWFRVIFTSGTAAKIFRIH